MKTFLKLLCPNVSDRFTAIHDEITEWQKQDPKLSDKESFLEYIGTRDIGQFNVGDTKRWMEHYKKAKKRGITVAELLFETRKKMLNVSLSYERGDPGENEQKLFVIDEEKHRELDQIDERLKTYDPARVKRRGKQVSLK